MGFAFVSSHITYSDSKGSDWGKRLRDLDETIISCICVFFIMLSIHSPVHILSSPVFIRTRTKKTDVW